MILTLTLNPAVDISYKLERLELGVVNRVTEFSKTAGGKGLNVARVLHQLGEDVAASGFLGGSLGGFISAELQAAGINDLFVPIQGENRNCIAILHEGKQTEILESGPIISEEEVGFFLKKFEEYVQQVDVVTISGSLPRGLSDGFYAKLIGISNSYETKVLLDANGALLRTTLNSTSKPYFIKPNEEEMAELLGKSTVDEIEIISALETRLFTDIPWVVVTLGVNGAIVKHNNTIYRAALPKVKAINPVGSGDSVVAGFAAGIARGLSDEKLIKFGLTMGVLNALEEETGYINIEEVDTILSQIQVASIGIL